MNDAVVLVWNLFESEVLPPLFGRRGLTQPALERAYLACADLVLQHEWYHGIPLSDAMRYKLVDALTKEWNRRLDAIDDFDTCCEAVDLFVHQHRWLSLTVSFLDRYIERYANNNQNNQNNRQGRTLISESLWQVGVDMLGNIWANMVAVATVRALQLQQTEVLQSLKARVSTLDATFVHATRGELECTVLERFEDEFRMVPGELASQLSFLSEAPWLGGVDVHWLIDLAVVMVCRKPPATLQPYFEELYRYLCPRNVPTAVIAFEAWLRHAYPHPFNVHQYNPVYTDLLYYVANRSHETRQCVTQWFQDHPLFKWAEVRHWNALLRHTHLDRLLHSVKMAGNMDDHEEVYRLLSLLPYFPKEQGKEGKEGKEEETFLRTYQSEMQTRFRKQLQRSFPLTENRVDRIVLSFYQRSLPHLVSPMETSLRDLFGPIRHHGLDQKGTHHTNLLQVQYVLTPGCWDPAAGLFARVPKWLPACMAAAMQEQARCDKGRLTYSFEAGTVWVQLDVGLVVEARPWQAVLCALLHEQRHGDQDAKNDTKRRKQLGLSRGNYARLRQSVVVTRSVLHERRFPLWEWLTKKEEEEEQEKEDDDEDEEQELVAEKKKRRLLERQHALEAAIVRHAKRHRTIVVSDLLMLCFEKQEQEQETRGKQEQMAMLVLLLRCVKSLVDRGYLESVGEEELCCRTVLVYVP